MRETSNIGSGIFKRSKRITAGVLTALMVVTSVPTTGFGALEAKAAADTVTVYRSYNEASGEHLYTTDAGEHQFVVQSGRVDEKEAWVAPVKSNTEVYRSYNPTSGEHLLVPKSEAEGLVAFGWNNEGLKMYSDDEKGVAIYRVFNPNAPEQGPGCAGSHHYTASKGEAEALVAAGWKWDNNGEPVLYGVDVNAAVAIESVALDNTTPKVGDTITATTTPSNVKVEYKWFSGTDKASVNNPIAGETGKDLKVTSAMENNYIKVVVTDAEGNEKEATTEKTVASTELSLKSVETADSGAGNVIIAYFNQPVGDLQPGDIQIRRVSDDSLNTVEKVVMSSDKKTATMQVVGFAANNPQSLAANTDYKLIVSTDEGSASKVFSIPDVANEEVIDDFDVEKNTIGVNGTDYIDENGLVGDFNEVLGRTATFFFDKNNIITKFNLIDEKVIYSAIEAKDNDKDGNIDYIVTTDEKKYQLVGNGGDGKATETRTGGGNMYPTLDIVLDGNASPFDVDNTGIGDPAQTAKYAKIVLNPNGTVRTLVTVMDWDKSVYVASVKDKKYLVDVAGAFTDLTDFNIIKDGKTASIEDIEEGDVVFVSTDNRKKVAEIYSTNKVSGKMTVYTGKADIGKDRYDLEGSAVIGDEVKTATTANLKDYTGSEVVAYLDRANKLAQTIVSSETAADSSEFVIVTDNAKIYTEGTAVKVSFKGGNGTEIKDYVLNVDDLKSLTTLAGAKKKYVKDTCEPDSAPVGDFTGTFGLGSNADINVNEIVKGNLVKVIKNADGKVIGIELSDGVAADYDFKTADDKDMGESQNTQNFFEGKKTAMNTQANIGTLNGQMIEGSTPVYVYNKSNKTVKLVKYKDVDFTATAASIDQIQVRFNEAKVAAFYIDETCSTMAESAVDKTVRGILASKTLDKDSTNYAELEVYVGNDKITYKDFAQDCANDAGLVKDDFVDIKLTEDGKVYSVAEKAGAAAALGGIVTEDYVIDSKYILTTEAGVDTTIVVKANDGTYDTKTWSELGTLKNDIKTIKVATYGDSTSYVDAIWCELDGGATMIPVLAEAASMSAITVNVTCTATATTGTVALVGNDEPFAVAGVIADTTNFGITETTPETLFTITAIDKNGTVNTTTVTLTIAGTYYDRVLKFTTASDDSDPNNLATLTLISDETTTKP